MSWYLIISNYYADYISLFFSYKYLHRVGNKNWLVSHNKDAMSIVIWLGGERSELTIQSLQQRWEWEKERERAKTERQTNRKANVIFIASTRKWWENNFTKVSNGYIWTRKIDRKTFFKGLFLIDQKNFRLKMH